MKNISTLPLCQGGIFSEKNRKNINNLASYGIIDESHQLLESTMPTLEDTCVAKAKEALRQILISPKEALQILKNLELKLESKIEAINTNIKWIMAIGLLIVGIMLKSTFIH